MVSRAIVSRSIVSGAIMSGAIGRERAREALHEADAILAMAGVITRERTCAE